MKRTLKVVWRYDVPTSDIAQFQNWMEEKHIRAIYHSGCFLPEFNKLSDMKSDRGMQRQGIMYTLFPKSEEALAIFERDFEKGFERDFAEQWPHFVRLKKIIVNPIVGLESELKIVEAHLK